MKGMFVLGASVYPVLELLYRGRTHYSMALAGGLSAVLVKKISESKFPFPVQVLFCGLGITFIEAICGMIWNRRYSVWDYRHMPLNWRGQICLPYTLLWCGLSIPLLLGIASRTQRSRR